MIKFRVYNKENNKTIFEGKYEKPNWVVRFEVSKINQDGEIDSIENDNYSCTAFMAQNNEFSEQSQTNNLDNKLLDSEGENSENLDKGESVIGGENREKLIDEKAKSLNSKTISPETKNNMISQRIINLDDEEEIESLKELSVENPSDKTDQKEKMSEALLWHVRLGHASLTYLQMMQKKEKILEDIEFDDSIKDCEVCILSKMEKVPFKQGRSRAERPLQMIHTDLMGPIKPKSWPGQKRFIVSFICDHSRYAMTYCLKTKDEAGEAFEKYIISARV